MTPFTDWNQNGERDRFDTYMDRKAMTNQDSSDPPAPLPSGSVHSSSQPTKQSQKETASAPESNGFVIFKSLLVIALCIVPIILIFVWDVDLVAAALLILVAAAFAAVILSIN